MSAESEDHEYLLYRIRKAGTSFAQIARDIGVAPATITVVSKGRRSENVERALAAALGLSAEELFPARYPTDREVKDMKT